MSTPIIKYKVQTQSPRALSLSLYAFSDLSVCLSPFKCVVVGPEGVGKTHWLAHIAGKTRMPRRYDPHDRPNWLSEVPVMDHDPRQLMRRFDTQHQFPSGPQVIVTW